MRLRHAEGVIAAAQVSAVSNEAGAGDGVAAGVVHKSEALLGKSDTSCLRANKARTTIKRYD